ncbi:MULTISPECIES: ABC transporter permease [unclassified Aureimonas]|uniref:ABC transporter permease n=1 Tax=unclassified Aureimonas TaxID=2615206 RepID=UPI000701EAAA|nr:MULTISPECIES: ABC transporter permease [unclassified Aureimonas]KQT64452.1 ABC transporter permease [Aureimonas sp. Leaf427]KQT81640.1 ABC transporter permease [Aureimonas sp. Leaf460]
MATRIGIAPYLQVAPFALIFLLFLVVPLAIIVMVSFWTYDNYSIQPAFTMQNYMDVFDRCIVRLPTLCTTFRTYVSTLQFSATVWLITLVIGFTVAYFVAFEVRTPEVQSALFLICTIPFWTSNVIRMISWIPLLGREGLVNQMLVNVGAIDQPLDWLLYSRFSVTLTFVHLFTFFMVVPIYNSMLRIDRSLIEAARDAGASSWQILWNVIIPLSKTGIAIGSIFVITLVMGDFITIGLMGGQQIASVGKTISVEVSYLQFPIAAANAVVLLATVLLIIFALTRLVDIRKEL